MHQPLKYGVDVSLAALIVGTVPQAARKLPWPMNSSTAMRALTEPLTTYPQILVLRLVFPILLLILLQNTGRLTTQRAN